MARMKLRSSRTSPFVRKVLVFAHEAGLGDRIDTVAADVWSADTDIHADNPLGKVPVLVTDDGNFIGSYLACEYLDSLNQGRNLIPFMPPQRWRVLQLHALADGVMEASVARVIESHRRPKPSFSPEMAERQEKKIRLGLEALEARAGQLFGEPNIATITLACALSYLDIRGLDDNWRRFPELARFHEGFSKRRSMVKTEPGPL